jgi:hypothetical protein
LNARLSIVAKQILIFTGSPVLSKMGTSKKSSYSLANFIRHRQGLPARIQIVCLELNGKYAKH